VDPPKPTLSQRLSQFFTLSRSASHREDWLGVAWLPEVDPSVVPKSWDPPSENPEGGQDEQYGDETQHEENGVGEDLVMEVDEDNPGSGNTGGEDVQMSGAL
jgi:hypothetical protein